MKKSVITVFSLLLALALASCGTAGDSTAAVPAGSTAEVSAVSETQETSVRIVLHEDGNHTFNGAVCTGCGYVDMKDLQMDEAIGQYGYYHVDRDGSGTVNTGDLIFFGAYPGTRVEEDLSAALTDSWTDYGYYAGLSQEALLFWQDLIVDGVKYRAVRVDGYRPYYTDLAASEEKSYLGTNGYTPGNIYYFRYEPIEWRVLDFANGEALLNTVRCIDGQNYCSVYYKDGSVYYGDAAKTYYANDWEHSDIRAFLNGSFSEWAFDDREKALLAVTELDNTSSYDPSNTFAKDQHATLDQVFLLSWQDLQNGLYGFSESLIKTGTDYAESQGLRTSQQSADANGERASWWSLRSSGGKSFSLCGVNKYGEATKSNTTMYSDSATDGIVTYTAEGISPAVSIKIGK